MHQKGKDIEEHGEDRLGKQQSCLQIISCHFSFGTNMNNFAEKVPVKGKFSVEQIRSGNNLNALNIQNVVITGEITIKQ